MKLIDTAYIKTYNDAFSGILKSAPFGTFDENALPAYTHPNPLMSWLFWKRIDAALSMAGDVKGRRVLDFGCGGGVTFKYLYGKGAIITGCDNQSAEIARSMCAITGAKADVFAGLGDIKERGFDLIFYLDVLEHLNNSDEIIKELIDAAAPDAKFIVSGPTENMFYKIGRMMAGFKGHYHVKNIYDIESSLQAAGLKRISIRRLYPPCTLFRISMWGR